MIIDKLHHAQPIRDGDRCFMDVIVESGHFNKDDLITIGICRKYKGVHMTSCLVRCDGREVRQDILDDREGLSRRKFPEEHPTPAMLAVWNKAVMSIASDTVNGKMCLPSALGQFKETPLKHEGWHASDDDMTLYHEADDGSHAVFVKVDES